MKCFLVERFFIDSGEAVPVGHYEKEGERIEWRRVETKEVLDRRALPVGALYRSWWMEEIPGMSGIDGQSWTVVTPGGEWLIDSRASNCTAPNDTTHKCWCRHGVAPNFTVNKNGNTCNAGAGSIAIGNYHGHLINGELTDC